MTYDIVLGESAEELTTQVMERIARGWKPQGGVSMYVDVHGNEVWAQAVIFDKAPGAKRP